MKAEAPEPSIRGAYIAPGKAWIIKTYGQDIFKSGVDLLSKEQQHRFAGPIVSNSWYSLQHWEAICDEVRVRVKKKTGEEEATFDRRRMHESVSSTMQTIYRIAFPLFDPTTLVSKVEGLFNRVYSHGTYHVLENVNGRCRLAFRDAPIQMLPEMKRSFPLAAGWMLEMAKQDITRMELTPQLGDTHFSCELLMEYEKRKRK